MCLAIPLRVIELDAPYALGEAGGLHNFTIYCLLKRTREVIETLLQDPDCRIDGFLCPGHVAAIIGTEGFRFLERYQKSGVICGFESTDIL